MEDFFSFETKDQHIFFRNENDKKTKKKTKQQCSYVQLHNGKYERKSTIIKLSYKFIHFKFI